jgi:MFS family permease
VIGVLRHRDFSLLFWGGLVSTAGDWLLFAVLPYVVYARTGSTIATAGMTVAELAPGIVLGSVAGVFVDRWDRRRLLVTVNLVQALVVLALLAFVADVALLWAVYVVAAAQSALSAFSMPAENALLPTLVGPDELVEANAMNALNNRVGRLAGLAAGPVIYALGGLAAVTIADAASFVVAGVLVALMRSRPVVREGSAEPGRFFVEWRDGLRLVRRERSIGVLFVVFGLMTFGGTMLDPLSAPWVRDVLHAGPGVYALLKAVHAASGIVGSVLVGSIGARWSPRLLCGVGSLVACALLLVRFNVPVVGVAVTLSAVAGAVAVGSSVGVETMAQQRVPEDYRGRVFGTLQATIWLLSLLGALVGGVGAEWLGVVGMLNFAALLVGVAGVVVLLAIPAEPARLGPR